MPSTSRSFVLRLRTNSFVGLACFSIYFCFTSLAMAQFSPGPNPITTTQTAARTLSAGTGTINVGGAISIASGSTVPLTMTGISTLVNNGTIQTLGSGRAIDSNASGTNLTVTNTGLISSVSADAFRVNNAGSSVSLDNSGTIQVTNGGQAIDWASITTGSNSLTNQASGIISAVGEDAIRPGQNGIVNNAGSISATMTGPANDPSGSDGIDLRTQKNITVTNTGTISGRHGIATDGANAGPSSLIVNNNAGTISAINGSGLNVDGVSVNVTANVTNLQGATIKGGVAPDAAALEGDGDGIDIDGVLTLNNSGDVLGLGAKGGTNNAEGIAAGGGSITNYATGKIVGSTLAADAPNGDTSKAGNGILIDDSNGGNAVAATTVTNSGLIQGKSGFGIKFIGTFADTITNNAGGTIRGAGTGAAIQTGGGGDTVTNRGAIIGENGSAIDLEDGDDFFVVDGGAAIVTGSISGGSGTNTATFDPGAAQSFSYAGALSNFNTVEVKSGQVTISGVNLYTGTTLVTGGVLALDGANRLAASSSLNLNGGTLEFLNAGGPNGQTFASLALSNDSVLDLNSNTSVTFNSLGSVSAGESLAILGYSASLSPSYAIRFSGDLTGNATFLSLMGNTSVNGNAALFFFDGTFTDVVELVPAPEPSSLALLGLGVLFVARRARRQKLMSRQSERSMLPG